MDARIYLGKTVVEKMKDWHEKPPPEVRSVEDALASAERRRRDLPIVAQVHAYDWDTVILADEVKRLRELGQMAMMRWNPNTSQMEPFNYSDDQKGSR